MTLRRTSLAVAALAIVAAACGSDDPAITGSSSVASSTTESTVAAAIDETTTTSPPPTTTAPVIAGVASSDDLPNDLPLVTSTWRTDWQRTTIDFTELGIGIFATDPRDAIAPIDEPKFESVEDATQWLSDREPGVLLPTGTGARFYSLSILTLHEIINDTVDGVPIAVTYCPLCNTAIVFDRRVNGEVHRFGVSGLLRNSDLVMWDDRTDSLWQQITGEGIVGTYAGAQLTVVPSSIVSFSEFRDALPDAEVLSRDTGFGYPYGINPYELYSSRPRPFGFFDGELDDRYPALERVVGVTVGDTHKAYPFSEISGPGVVNDAINEEPVVVFWGGVTADALDTSQIADARAVGTGVAYTPIVDGQLLTFTQIGDAVYTDDQTGSEWSILGHATAGPLEGSTLATAIHRNEFWFAWIAFFGDADVYVG